MKSFKRLTASKSFFERILSAKSDPERLKRIIEEASPRELRSLGDILKNLKHIPLKPSEKVRYCRRRAAIKRFINSNTNGSVRRQISLKRGVQTGRGVGEEGGIFPLIPAIASLGISLLTSLLKK
jgi:hypothetical protein